MIDAVWLRHQSNKLAWRMTYKLKPGSRPWLRAERRCAKVVRQLREIEALTP